MLPLQDILTVSELNNKIKLIIEQNFRFVQLIGEISNFRIHSQSGHYYFTLKDDGSQVQAVMWKTRNQSLLFTPEDGMQVVIKGRVTVYGAKGSYQVEVWEIKPQGAGELQLKFEKLKLKLFEEGLFDEDNKKPVPKYPSNVAIITSKTGAVIHDFIKVIERRYPVLNIYLYPVNVQGEKVTGEVINALKYLQAPALKREIGEIDIIVIARGGGSLEDIYPFNSEKLARAVSECKIPVVSAIGHEVDYTICDFVADLRAPTPSAAAELITPNLSEMIENIGKFSYFYKSIVNSKVGLLKNAVREIEANYYINRPKDIISNYNMRLDNLSGRMSNITYNKVNNFFNQIKSYKKTLYHISPQNTMKKGYALVYKNELDIFTKDPDEIENKKLVTRAGELEKYDDVDIKFYDKKRSAKIIK
ncbi:MAG: exodeoxyribonuclease VII large subunit [Ignavibacteriae bacterium]|nr:MAG: exodeoxyribonuclease VII large subunit [Ignavibacteriota bacterium]